VTFQVKAKYSEQFEPEEIEKLLAMEKSGGFGDTKSPKASVLPAFLANVDWKYEIWKWGVIITDNVS